MLPLSYIVSVQVTRETQSVTQAGFGTILILGANGTYHSERIREYRTIDEVVVDFATSSAEYLAAQAVFNQNPNPGIVKIGIEGTRVAQIETIVFSANIITGNTINLTVGAVALTQAFTTDNATTLAALATQIAAQPHIGSAVSDASHTITVTASAAGIPFLLTSASVTGGASQATIVMTITTANHGLADDLSEISLLDDDWYGLIWTERTLAFTKYCADSIQSRTKIYITASSDSNILLSTSTTDLAYYVKANNYTRTAVIYNADPTDFIDAGWMSVCFTFSPGTENWAFKTIIGAVADNLSSNQVTNVNAKNGSVYVTSAGIDHTEFGNTGQGYIDQTRFIDAVVAGIQQNVFGLLVAEPKVPYTDAGIESIKNQIRAVLQSGEDLGAIVKDPKYEITAPSAVTAPQADRAQRILRNVRFNFRMSDGINQVLVNGVVSV